MSYTTDEGLTVTPNTSPVRPGDEAKVLAGAPSTLSAGMGDLFHVVGVLVSDVAAIKERLGIQTVAPTETDVADSGLTTDQTTPSVRPGDEAQVSFVADTDKLPPPAPVAEAPAADPTKDPATVPLGGSGSGTGDASQPATESVEEFLNKPGVPDFIKNLIQRGEGLVGGV